MPELEEARDKVRWGRTPQHGHDRRGQKKSPPGMRPAMHFQVLSIMPSPHKVTYPPVAKRWVQQCPCPRTTSSTAKARKCVKP
ncbi:MAG: hypothetical protein CM1200mP29_02900 [Verrucomicrobiota bacterium]|nr:MAG: hypothetical protein CM1200mP29_02900 [Verrucomicrobiota bacterium]